MPPITRFARVLPLVLATGCAAAPPSDRGASSATAGPVDWPLSAPAGQMDAVARGDGLAVSNNIVAAEWSVRGGHLACLIFSDRLAGKILSFAGTEPFSFTTEAGEVLPASRFQVVGAPTVVALAADPKGIRLADRLPGKAVAVSLRDPASGLRVEWRAELREGSNYVRQHFTFQLEKDAKPLTLGALAFAELPTPCLPANSLGTVPGSPYAIPGGNFLAGLEQPGYWAVASPRGGTLLQMPTQMRLTAGDAYTVSSVLGVFPKAQRRRSFAYYLERERASPSRHYLHYNAWYDLGMNISEKTLLKVERAYGEELRAKRGIPLDGFVLDDGWDAPHLRLWKADPRRFPQGWAALKKEVAQNCGASLGIWISPCGGYGGRDTRLASAKKLGALPATAAAFDLGEAGYYNLYRDICRELIQEGGMNYFKWDNAAPYENSGRTFGNLKSTSHFMRLCQLAAELRRDKPDLFINATVGTWPSPFWLNHVDCTWRMGGPDVSWVGKGDKREQSLNYRDGEVHDMVVKRAPLYPLNSMMFHGVVLGHEFQGATTTKAAGNDMTREFRSYFALGTNMQELYLSPDLMSAKNWDDLAECIRWNQKHADILVDAHWVGGDPLKGEPYAVAAWRRNQGTLMLRNPSDRPQTFTLDVGAAFELPAGAAKRYRLGAAYPDQRAAGITEVSAGTPAAIELQPFEVLVLDAVAAGD